MSLRTISTREVLLAAPSNQRSSDLRLGDAGGHQTYQQNGQERLHIAEHGRVLWMSRL